MTQRANYIFLLFNDLFNFSKHLHKIIFQVFLSDASGRGQWCDGVLENSSGTLEQFPLLATFFRAYSSFQPTSVASERVFNIDGLVMTKLRKNMDPERGESMVVSQDFLKRRVNKEEFCFAPSAPSHRVSRHATRSHVPSTTNVTRIRTFMSFIFTFLLYLMVILYWMF